MKEILFNNLTIINIFAQKKLYQMKKDIKNNKKNKHENIVVIKKQQVTLNHKPKIYFNF